MIVHQNVFYHKPRIFIETVTGCRNFNCTSPCEALELPISMMPPSVCGELISYFKNRAIEVYLYGRGDCSLYPYERVSANLSGCVLNITANYLKSVRRLKDMGLKIFVRCDCINDLSEDYWLEADGVFMVVGAKDKYLRVVSKVLEKEKPFMLRSVCNKPTNPPIPIEDMINSLLNIGYEPSDVYISELPEPGCNVTTIRHNGNLKMACCILHNKEYQVKSLDSIARMLLKKYEHPGWKPCSWCGHNAIYRGNYRLYFEQEGL